MEGMHLKVQRCFTIAFDSAFYSLVHSSVKKSLALNVHYADIFISILIHSHSSTSQILGI